MVMVDKKKGAVEFAAMTTKMNDRLNYYKKNEPEKFGPLLIKVAESMVEGQEYYKKISAGPSVERANYAHTLLDRYNYECLNSEQERVKCKKRCSFCCHMQVNVTQSEAMLLAEKVKSGEIKLNAQRLAEQSAWKEGEWTKRRGAPCVFLKQGECRAYRFRPGSCRNHFSLEPPETHCDLESDTDIGGPLRVLSSIQSDITLSALMDLESDDTQESKDKGKSLPFMLNRCLEKGR